MWVVSVVVRCGGKVCVSCWVPTLHMRKEHGGEGQPRRQSPSGTCPVAPHVCVDIGVFIYVLRVSFSRVSPFSGVSGVLRFIHTQWQYTHTRIYVMVLWFIGRKAIPSFPPREVLQDYIRGRLAKAGTKQIQKERARERESDRATESVCV